jgi:predicted ATPase
MVPRLMSFGWWLYRSGSDCIRGVAIMQDGLAGSELIGTVRYRPFFMSLLARAYLDDGKVEQARGILDAALELTEPRGNLWWVPELRRLRALCDARAPTGLAQLAPACSTRQHGT